MSMYIAKIISVIHYFSNKVNTLRKSYTCILNSNDNLSRRYLEITDRNEDTTPPALLFRIYAKINLRLINKQ